MLKHFLWALALSALVMGCSQSGESTTGTPAETTTTGSSEGTTGSETQTTTATMDFATLQGKLTTYCAKCHSGDAPAGGIGIDKITDEAAAKANAETMHKAAEELKERKMPPAKETNQPSDEDRAAMVAALEAF